MKISTSPTRTWEPRIVVVGGGYVGLCTALGLQKRLRRNEAKVTVIDPRPVMTYQPFLAEVAGGSIEPRHVAVPLRRALKGCEVLTAAVTGVDQARRRVQVQPSDGPAYDVDYDALVLAPGSVSRVLPIPGLAEHAVGFTTIGEALHLRDHVLSRLDLAASTTDPAARGRALTFVFVGGGYSGVEALAELEDLARYASRMYPGLDPAEMRWTLVEASDRILPEVSLRLSDYTVRRLERRGVRVLLNTHLVSVEADRAVLSDGTELAAGTLVWTAGVRPNPLVGRLGLPVDASDRLECTPQLRVVTTANIWAAGDCASVPDLSHRDDPAAVCPPTAQHAVRQARRLAKNIVADLRRREPKPYRHADIGSIASLGLYKGVAQVFGIPVRGLLASMMHRGYHLWAVPTFDRKVRVLADWVLSFLLRREVAGASIGGTVEHHEVNRQPGAVFRDRDGRIVNTWTLDVQDGRVQTIRTVNNPDKLTHLGPVADGYAVARETVRARSGTGRPGPRP